MSSINCVGASSSSNTAAIYQEYLARLQAQKQATQQTQANEQSQPSAPSTGDADHDGDTH
jgi:hypothetical protein